MGSAIGNNGVIGEVNVNKNSKIKNDHQSVHLTHGGELEKFAKQYNRPIDQWLDLSTGISPFTYPIPKIPEKIWQRLPEQTESFIEAANEYYQTKNWLVCSGSQSAIQVLPKLWLRQCEQGYDVWLPKVGYKEHEYAWSKLVDNHLIQYQELPELKDLNKNAVVVVINPNNPSGHFYSKACLVQLAEHLKKVNGLLVIDEAFIDSENNESTYFALSVFHNVIILRSMGKFFGLAGMRIGFFLADQYWLKKLNHELGVWTVTGASLYIAERALKDFSWQKSQRLKLKRQSESLENLLNRYFTKLNGTNLFKTVKTTQAVQLHELLCQQGILVRLCDEKDALRFGIPDQQQTNRLLKVFKQIEMQLEIA